MKFILFDGPERFDLLPLVFTRPVCELRVGILTIKEKWENALSQKVEILTQDYLQSKYSFTPDTSNIYINGSVLPNSKLVEQIKSLNEGQTLVCKGSLVAYYMRETNFVDLKTGTLPKESSIIEYQSDCEQIKYPWNIFTVNGSEIDQDFRIITKDRISQPLSKTNTLIGEGNLFIEEGAKVECCILNPMGGNIYIGKDAEIMEGSVIRGSLALGEHAVIKLSAKIYGPTTIGPFSKVGGEINNSVIIGYTNKAHDGFLGNSVLGEWCNLGADTNNSNLKNNYEEVKVWNYRKEGFVKSGLQFCGLIMGDHSKCGINTMFNTGTVVGVSANIFGAGFPRNYIPSFSWGGAHGFEVYTLNKAFDTIEKVYQRRGMKLSDEEKNILTHIFNETTKFRRF